MYSLGIKVLNKINRFIILFIRKLSLIRAYLTNAACYIFLGGGLRSYLSSLFSHYYLKQPYCENSRFMEKLALSYSEKLPISAIIRTKNDSHVLELSMLSALTICEEVVVVLNCCTDSSREIVSRLSEKYERIRMYEYPFDLAQAGTNYKSQLRGKKSLSEFYNFSFSKGKSNYLMKWDSDMIALPGAKKHLARAVMANPDLIIFDGLDAFGVFTCMPEIRIFRSSLCWRFVDGPTCEEIVFGESCSIARKCIFSPIYAHFKLQKMFA